ncbi:hypothetical protein AUR04nite_32370 [Glutamicibacter uratoxydans]|uniref:Uncharacterized protein n=1 Tax=Glutamicibacter uratoxydans TaxID=43667 RepID=A0A4Y4DVS9_GLUUR|nr:hypothetical protein [Glutamicibacter uratoxydans]GED07705.1 hypothetical protein AUR04nite_32370 [Glutamicibacter uratoxydans]
MGFAGQVPDIQLLRLHVNGSGVRRALKFFAGPQLYERAENTIGPDLQFQMVN